MRSTKTSGSFTTKYDLGDGFLVAVDVGYQYSYDPGNYDCPPETIIHWWIQSADAVTVERDGRFFKLATTADDLAYFAHEVELRADEEMERRCVEHVDKMAGAW